MENSSDNEYTLSPQGKILSVGKNWDKHAQKNGASSAVSDEIIGRDWWEFISGPQTMIYLNSIFFACRMDNMEFSTLCRCDTLEEGKTFRLSVTPKEDGSLVVTNKYISSAGRWNRAANLSDRVNTTQCTICCSFRLGENWIDPLSDPNKLYFARGYDVCPTCKAKAKADLKEKGSRVFGSKVVSFSDFSSSRAKDD